MMIAFVLVVASIVSFGPGGTQCEEAAEEVFLGHLVKQEGTAPSFQVDERLKGYRKRPVVLETDRLLAMVAPHRSGEQVLVFLIGKQIVLIGYSSCPPVFESELASPRQYLGGVPNYFESRLRAARSYLHLRTSRSTDDILDRLRSANRSERDGAWRIVLFISAGGDPAFWTEVGRIAAQRFGEDFAGILTGWGFTILNDALWGGASRSVLGPEIGLAMLNLLNERGKESQALVAMACKHLAAAKVGVECKVRAGGSLGLPIGLDLQATEARIRGLRVPAQEHGPVHASP